MMRRDKCPICGDGDANYLDTFPDMPVRMGTTTDSPTKDLICDQSWLICDHCGCVYLHDLIDPEVLYAVSHNPGAVGEVWNKHHAEFGRYVADRSGEDIVEFGAGTDKLAEIIIGHTNIREYTIVDPNPILSRVIPQVSAIAEFLTPEFSTDLGNVDTIVHSHTMEHFYDVAGCIKKMAEILPIGGKMIFSVPLIDCALTRGHHNGIGFEHTYMTTMTNIERVLATNGFCIEDVTFFNYVNVFVTATRNSEIDVELVNEYITNKAIFVDYKKNLTTKYTDLLVHLEAAPFKPTFIFGAHLFSQTPLTLVPELLYHITAVLDNDPTKVNKRLYGVYGMLVMNPNILATMDARVIVDVGQYEYEIVRDLKKINPNLEII